MLRNYWKTAWRNLWKTRTFSAINVSGLAIGIAAFFLIVSYLHFEYSFDDYHVRKDRLFRVPMEVTEQMQPGAQPERVAFTYPAVAGALKRDFPEVQETMRIRKRWGVVRSGNNQYVEDDNFLYVDASIFRMFTFEFVAGDAENAFRELNDIVITSATAKKYFGDVNPLGQKLGYRDENFVVKAVIEDPPANSHLHFHILANYNKYAQDMAAQGNDAQNSWTWSDFYTYVLLRPGAGPEKLRAQLPAFAERHMGDKMKKAGIFVRFDLQPLKDIHLHSRYQYEWPGNGDLSYLKYLAAAALFLLVIAWINYISLSSARAIDRAKEVGVRKVIGAGKAQLIRQFLMESLLINGMSVVAGLIVYQLSLPAFSRLVELSTAELVLPGVVFWPLAALIFLLGSFLAGAYPSFILSSQAPLPALKPAAARVPDRGNKALVRRSLVVVQFFAAIVLICGARGLNRQVQYMSRADLGLNVRQTLILHQTVGQDSSKTRVIASFINDLESHPGIVSVTASTSVPGSEVGGSSRYHTLHSNAEKTGRNFGIDSKFIPDYGLTVVAGRNFITDKKEPTTNVILNEAAVRVFGFSSDAAAIGERIMDGTDTWQVVGVIRDYHQKTLQNVIDPIVFYPEEEHNMSDFSVKINTPDAKALLDFVRARWLSSFPESPFVYQFLDDVFNTGYRNERLFSTVLWLFTLLAVLVASLGLLGLSIYTVAKRRKEISIRKVLGATVLQIVRVVAKDFILLVLLSALGAIPLAWYLLQNWLRDYAFHISIGPWFFFLPVLMIITIAMCTVCYHSLTAALANPVKHLKVE
ncbi:MAG TPA: ABC transporter permease [Puia sp.]|nr:ABC transporter permease [Puia sp.]